MDGERVAYQVFGSGPIDLIFSVGTSSNIDSAWEYPAVAAFNARLASFCRVIKFDRRGAGASDPLSDTSRPFWEYSVEDIVAVLDAVGSERPVLLGYLDGGAASVAFAATYPERTQGLILMSTSARYVAAPDYPIGLSPDQADGLLELASETWGTSAFAALAFPSRAHDPAFLAWIAKFNRATSSAAVIRDAWRAILFADTRETLKSIRCPTLVMHARDNAFIPVEQGRYLADHISGARLELFSGGDTNLQYEHGEVVLELLEEFLTGSRRTPSVDRVLATVLFTDIVGSTERVASIGDRAWSSLLQQHDHVATAVTERFGGRLVKLTGDGALSTFTGPGRAIACARAMIDELGRADLQVRAGVHTGEIELRDAGDIGGIAVHIGSRIMDLAGPGEVFVSRTVRDLVSGSEIAFAGRGTHALKGVPQEWEVLAVV